MLPANNQELAMTRIALSAHARNGNRKPFAFNSTRDLFTDSAPGTVVGTVFAFDTNSEDILSYSLAAGSSAPHTPFGINAESGRVTVIAPLDHPLNQPEELYTDFLTCTMCPKMFKAEKNLKEHMKTHGTHVKIEAGQEVTFGCDRCPDRFATPAELDVHQRIHDLT